MKFIERKELKDKHTDLKFGKNFTDYMFMMRYHDGAWDSENACIKPYEPFVLDPSTSVFHYGQAVFEGLKAYRNDAGEVRLFRPMDNMKRMNESCWRLCMPQFDEKFVHDALVELVKKEKDWIPTAQGTSLYIRPFVIAVDKALGVHSAKNYIMSIILSPVGAYYAHGFDVFFLIESGSLFILPGIDDIEFLFPKAKCRLVDVEHLGYFADGII